MSETRQIIIKAMDRQVLSKERKHPKPKTKEDYPLVLRAQHIAEIMDLSETKAYDIMERKGFPLIREGRSKRCGRDAFFAWLDRQTKS